jgi:hypothetical protein
MARLDDLIGGGRYEKVRLADLTTDGRFNRPTSEKQIANIDGGFNMAAFRTIEVWQREDGRYVILDGQNRTEVLRRRGVPLDAKCVPAIVHRDLTVEEAAELFVLLNSGRAITPFDRFRAMLTNGEAETVAIDATVRSFGLRVTDKGADDALACPGTLYTVFRTGSPPGALLGRTLRALVEGFGSIKEALGAVLIRGVARYLYEHPDIDAGMLGEAFKYKPGAPIYLLNWAKTTAGGERRMTLEAAIAEVIEHRVMGRTRRRPKAANDG